MTPTEVVSLQHRSMQCGSVPQAVSQPGLQIDVLRAHADPSVGIVGIAIVPPAPPIVAPPTDKGPLPAVAPPAPPPEWPAPAAAPPPFPPLPPPEPPGAVPPSLLHAPSPAAATAASMEAIIAVRSSVR